MLFSRLSSQSPSSATLSSHLTPFLIFISYLCPELKMKYMNYGFVRIASAVPSVKVADCKYNARQIESLIAQAEGKGVEIICFPELSITGYTCGDLFSQQMLLDEAEMALIGLMNFTRSLDIISIVGLPVAYRGTLLNCAVVLQRGKILGIVPKTYLPNYKEFYEQRWFTSGAVHPDTCVLICGQQARLNRHLLFRTPSCCSVWNCVKIFGLRFLPAANWPFRERR